MAKGDDADEPEMLMARRAPLGTTAAKATTTMPPSERTHHGVELLDAQRARGLEAGARDVLDGQFREIQPIGLARGRVDRRGAGGAEAAAERVHAHHEEAVGVDGAAGADHLFPPAGVGIFRRRGGMRRRRQSGEQQDGIAALAVQLAPAFIGNLRAAQHATAAQVEGIGQRCVTHRRWRCGVLAQRRWWLQGSGSLPSLMPSASAVDR